MSTEIVEKLRKNELLTAILIILGSYAFMQIASSLIYAISHNISLIDGGAAILFLILLPGLVSSMVFHVIFRKVMKGLIVFLLATVVWFFYFLGPYILHIFPPAQI